MATNTLPRVASPILVSVRSWWQSLERPHKLIGTAAILVVCGIAYVSSVVADHIEQAFVHKAAARTALYMDSVVEPLVQDLAAKSSLSPETRQALERLLSPASIGRPLVAFRIWSGDRVAFSNEREIVGKQFPSASDRDRAFLGDVMARIGQRGGTDVQDRPGAPILQVYAPIRQTGSHRIIALAETSELAGELSREIRSAQYASYVVVASAAIALLLVLYSLGGGPQTRVGDLASQRAADQQFRRRMFKANGRMLELNERKLQHVKKELNAGPVQLAALALLKLDALSEVSGGADGTAAMRATEIDVIRKALKECLTQMRDVSAGLAPSEIEGLSLAEALSSAVCLHELRTRAAPVNCDFRGLPSDAPYPLKASLYQFVEQGLACAFQHTGGNVLVRATAGSTLEVEISYETQLPRTSTWLIEDFELSSESMRHRIEALGGTLLVHSPADCRLHITAAFDIADLGTTENA